MPTDRNTLRGLYFLAIVILPLLFFGLRLQNHLVLSSAAAAHKSGSPIKPPASSPFSKDLSVALTPLTSIERTLGPGEFQVFRLQINEGYFVDLEVEQAGIDVILELFGDDDKLLLRVDTPQGPIGTERIAFVADTSQTHFLLVRAQVGQALAGQYRIKTYQLRTPTSNDRKRHATQDALWTASGIEQQPDERAEELYHRALLLSQELADPEQSSLAWLRMGNFLRSRRTDAGAAYSRALALARKSGNRNLAAVALFHLAEVSSDLNRTDEAANYIESAIDLVEESRRSILAEISREAYLRSRQEYYELYIELLMTLHTIDPTAGYDGKALETTERRRARGLLEGMREASGDFRSAIPAELLADEQLLLTELDALAAKEEESVEHQRSQRDLLLQLDRVKAEMRAVNPRSMVINDLGPLDLETMQGLLDADTQVLIFSLGEKRSFLWLLGRNTIHSYSLSPRGVLESLAQQSYELLAQSNFRFTRPRLEFSLNSLSLELLGPAVAELKASRLVVIADGKLQLVPFGTLPVTSESSGKGPLIARHEIVSAPSVSVLHFIRRHSITQSEDLKTIAVVADPVYSLEDPRITTNAVRGAAAIFPRLVASGAEAKEIANLVPRESSIVALGFKANRDTLTSGFLNGYRYLHVAAHAVVEGSRNTPRIVLSRFDKRGRRVNGTLQAHDIMKLRLSADLVVLSACGTALRDGRSGTSLNTLTTAFFYSGASRVLATLWRVDDEASAAFMQYFYRAMLSDGRSASVALRHAQLSLQENSRWKAPFYWAGFVLQGDWEQSEDGAAT